MSAGCQKLNQAQLMMYLAEATASSSDQNNLTTGDVSYLIIAWIYSWIDISV